MALVIIPPPYRGPTQGAAEVEIDAPTVGAALDALAEKFPGIGELILDANREFHGFVKVFVNEDAVLSGQLDRELSGSDRLEIVAAVAGG